MPPFSEGDRLQREPELEPTPAFYLHKRQDPIAKSDQVDLSVSNPHILSEYPPALPREVSSRFFLAPPSQSSSVHHTPSSVSAPSGTRFGPSRTGVCQEEEIDLWERGVGMGEEDSRAL